MGDGFKMARLDFGHQGAKKGLWHHPLHIQTVILYTSVPSAKMVLGKKILSHLFEGRLHYLCAKDCFPSLL